MITKIGGIVLMLVAIFLGTYAIIKNKTPEFCSSGNISVAPERIKVTNLADNSFTITWVTPNKASYGYLLYGDAPSKVTTNAIDDRDQSPVKRFTHHVTVKNLDPKTTYYYTIKSEGKDFNDGDKPYAVTTAPTTQDAPAVAVPFVGKVLTSDNQIADEVLVIGESANGTPISTYTNDKGNWVLTLNNARTQDLSSYLPISSDQQVHLTLDDGRNTPFSKEVTAKDKADYTSVQLGVQKQELEKAKVHTPKKDSSPLGWFITCPAYED